MPAFCARPRRLDNGGRDINQTNRTSSRAAVRSSALSAAPAPHATHLDRTALHAWRRRQRQGSRRRDRAISATAETSAQRSLLRRQLRSDPMHERRCRGLARWTRREHARACNRAVRIRIANTRSVVRRRQPTNTRARRRPHRIAVHDTRHTRNVAEPRRSARRIQRHHDACACVSRLSVRRLLTPIRVLAFPLQSLSRRFACS